MSSALSRSPFDDKGIRLSLLACLVGFGGFLVWAGFAKLDEGVTASGQVVVMDNRKQVQHFEGGIIRSLNVREGELVTQGDVLLVLEPLQSESARDEVAQEYAVQTATSERLRALRAGAETVTFPVLGALSMDDQTKADMIARQSTLFAQQLRTRDAERSVLTTRKESLEGRSRDLSAQIAASRRALTAAREDLALREEMLAEKLETIGAVQQVRRDVASLEADLSRLIGDRNETVKSAEEVTNQLTQAEAEFQEQVGEQLVEAQRRAAGARERLLAQEDRLARTTITAPQSGTVLNLAHSTVGGVVSPGESIMEIVPTADKLVVTVRLSPTDRDAVSPGQAVEAQLTAYKSFVAPRLAGEVTLVSADLKQDDATGTYYYEARVVLDASSLPAESRIEIIPGMPVETFIASGSARTFLDYMFEPIFGALRRGTRMN